MNNQTPTVSQVVNAVKNVLEGQFRSVEVIGEVSNLSSSGAGHYYFTLSDKQASLSCSLFRMDALRNPMIKQIKNGDKIIATGPLGVYAKRGTFQLVAKRIAPVGKGDLKEQLELLKKRLASDGLFDMEAKKTIPRFPKRIGLITAYGSAAYHDFVNVTDRRTLWMDLLVEPAAVQGDRAAASLRAALHKLIKFHMEAPEDKKLDVIVLTRGGGSLEDLWCFNDEGLAWDIFNCPIPVISAVGHEVDYSISDFVADKRCETPTAAAEVLSEGQTQLKMSLEHKRRRLEEKGQSIHWSMERKLSQFSPEQMMRQIEGRVRALHNRLEQCKIDHRLLEFTGYHDHILRLEDCAHRLKRFPERVEALNRELEKKNDMLRLLNPKQILGRGYSYVQRESGEDSGKVIANVKEFENLNTGETLKIHFHDGVGKVSKA